MLNDEEKRLFENSVLNRLAKAKSITKEEMIEVGVLEKGTLRDIVFIPAWV